MCLDEKCLQEKLYRNKTPSTKFEMIGEDIFAGSVDHHLQRSIISKVWLLVFNFDYHWEVQFQREKSKSFTVKVNLGVFFWGGGLKFGSRPLWLFI